MAEVPAWLRTTSRYGQVNLNERDFEELDVELWARQWADCGLESITLNIGGSLAFYPSEVPGHPHVAGAEKRDIVGELAAAATELGIQVLGRLEISMVSAAFKQQNPDWVMRNADGTFKSPVDFRGLHFSSGRVDDSSPGQLYFSCVNSGMFSEMIPAVLRESWKRYPLAGFFTNGFPILGLVPADEQLACHCAQCLRLWREEYGDLPYAQGENASPESAAALSAFIQDSNLRAIAHLRAVTKSLSPDASFLASAAPFMGSGIPWKRWIASLDAVASDAQDRLSHSLGPRTTPSSLWEVALGSELLRSVRGDLPSIRFIATYQLATLRRHVRKEPAELILHMAEALAHGDVPKWHSLSGRQHDRRWMRPVAEFQQWLRESEVTTSGARPLADVAVLWSQRSAVARWEGELAGESGPDPFEATAGWFAALTEARVPFDLVHEDFIENLDRYRVVVLPTGLILSDDALAAVSRYARGQGAIVGVANGGAAGDGSQPFDDIFGVRRGEMTRSQLPAYLNVESGDRPAPVFDSLGATDVIAAGPWTVAAEPAGAKTFGAFNPSGYVGPTAIAWLPEADTDKPALAWREDEVRSVYLSSSLDVAFFREHQSDHLRLLAESVKWAAGEREWSLAVTGAGLVDVRAWSRPDRLSVFLVNIDNATGVGFAATSLRPLGPLSVAVDLHTGARVADVRLKRAGAQAQWDLSAEGILTIEVPRVDDLEVIDVTWENADG